MSDIPLTKVDNIKSTVYLHNDYTIIAIGSWSEKDELVPLNIDWTALGLDKDHVRLYCPEITGLQQEMEYRAGQPVPVERGQGMILVLEAVIASDQMNTR